MFAEITPKRAGSGLTRAQNQERRIRPESSGVGAKVWPDGLADSRAKSGACAPGREHRVACEFQASSRERFLCVGHGFQSAGIAR